MYIYIYICIYIYIYIYIYIVVGRSGAPCPVGAGPLALGRRAPGGGAADRSDLRAENKRGAPLLRSDLRTDLRGRRSKMGGYC